MLSLSIVARRSFKHKLLHEFVVIVVIIPMTTKNKKQQRNHIVKLITTFMTSHNDGADFCRMS